MPSTSAITKSEYKDIELAFKELYQKVKPNLTEEDDKHIKAAYTMAVDSHGNQRRKSGEPYILHPIEVARICFDEIGLGPTAVISAILHDVVEDTDVEIEDIYNTYGSKICKIVDGLTKLDGLYNVESPQAENFKKVLSTLTEDVRVVLIKMADRLHNLRTIGSMPEYKQLKIAAETAYVYIPLAHRLGLYKLKTEFQDICLKINEKERYEDIANKLAQSKEERQAYVAEFLKPIKSGLSSLGIKYRVLGRPKAISSILNKIEQKKVPFEEIYDLFAVRIIADVPLDIEKTTCWQIYSLITDYYKPIPERLKDWVTSPKGNGYESLHTTVIGPNGRYVEVQVRTERMDDIAERGFAAHWKYKGVKNEHSVYDRWINGVREILEVQHTNAVEFLNDFKQDLFNEEVYVFTPQGDMRILPKGATALDFAFDIHSDVGYRSTSIKVNNKLVPMGYVLNNGDQLHVTTNKNQKPTEDWLRMVVTGKARSKIRNAMKEEKRKQGEVGQESLTRKLKNLKVDYDESVDMLVKHFNLNNRPDLYFEIATGKIKMTFMRNFEVVNNKLVLKTTDESDSLKEIKGGIAPQEEKITPRVPSKREAGKSILVNDEAIEKFEHELAQCCTPVSGDSIFAFITNGNGLKIHRTNCKNATHLLANFGYRVLKAEWTGKPSTNFIVDLLITGVDSGVGVIQLIAEVLSKKMGINIRSFSIQGTEGVFEGRVSIFVLNKDQLNQVVKAVKQLEGITNVTRIEK